MLEFQFYFYPLSRWWRYLMVTYDTFDDLLEETIDGPYPRHHYLTIGPLQWRWIS